MVLFVGKLSDIFYTWLVPVAAMCSHSSLALVETKSEGGFEHLLLGSSDNTAGLATRVLVEKRLFHQVLQLLSRLGIPPLRLLLL